MPWQFTSYLIPLFVAAGILLVILWYSTRHLEAPGAKTLAWVCFFASEWSIGYIMELASVDLSAKIFWAKMEYVGIVGVPMAWLAFALDYTNRRGWLTRRNMTLAALIPVLTLVFNWTTETHGLIWRSVSIDPASLVPALSTSYGPFFWVHLIYSYAAMLAGTVLMINRTRRSQPLYRWQAALIVFAGLGPWLGNLVYIFRWLPVANLDPTPFAFALTALALAVDIFRFRLLDIVPVARKAVIDGLSDGVIVLDVRDRIVDLNPSAQRIAAIDPRSIGKPIAQVLWHWPSLLEEYYGGPEGRAELVQEAAEGDREARWYDVRVTGVYERPQRLSGRLIVLHDITDRKQAEKALAVARDEALETTALKSQLLTKVGHEFKTPLGTVLGYAELMQRGTYGPVSERQGQVIERMIHSARYLNTLVSELLDEAQLEAGKVRLTIGPFAPREMIDQVCAQMSVLTEAKGLALASDIDPDLPGVLMGDPDRLQQILINLIGNALKFTQSGQIRVYLYAASSERWAMQVADTGPGISPEAQGHIFEPFWQMDVSLTGNGKGYGLGLAIVRQLTALMGGEIVLDSQVGRGSTFTILLPLVPAAELVM